MGELDSAKRTLREMTAVGVRPNAVTYNALIACCVRASRSRDAADLLEEMTLAGI